MDEVANGTISRYLKSEDIPENNTGPIIKVVANTFNFVVR
jgi:hypothetical protein